MGGALNLRTLSSRFTLGAITNGNADPDAIGIGHYFDFVVTPAEAGAAKPSPEIFHAALSAAGTEAASAVHVGDDPERDILGAAAVGMQCTVWVNASLAPWPGGRLPDAGRAPRRRARRGHRVVFFVPSPARRERASAPVVARLQARMNRCNWYFRPSALVAARMVSRYMLTHTPLVRNR